jgi:hypothetical protein
LATKQSLNPHLKEEEEEEETYNVVTGPKGK